MSLSEQERTRSERLLAQGVPANMVAAAIKKGRTQVLQKSQSDWGKTVDFGKGVLKGIGDAGVSLAELSGDISYWGANKIDAGLAKALSYVTGDKEEDVFKTINDPTRQSETEYNTAIEKGYDLTKAEGSMQEGGKVTGEIATWLLPQSKITKAAKVLPLGGRVLAEATGGAGVGYLIGGENREKDALYGGLGGAGGELLGTGLKVLPKLKTPTRLKDIFKGKKVASEVVEDTTKLGVKGAGDIAPVVDDLAPQTPIELAPDTKAALADPATGLTKENQPLLSQALDTESSLLTQAEKKMLVEADSTMYKNLETALKNTEVDLKAPSIHEVGLDMFEEALNKYKAVNKAAGKRVGETIERIKSLRLKSKQPVTDAIERFTTKLKEQNVIINDDGIVEVLGNSPFKGKESEIQEIYSVLRNIQEKDSAKEVLLGISQLDDKIVYGKSADLTKSVQGIAGDVVSDLRAMRNELMTADELANYSKYGETIELINKFNKGDPQQKMSVLLNTAGSQRGFKLNNFAGDILKVTGHDIRDIGLILNTFMKRLPKNNPNVSRLTQIVGGNVPLSTYGIATAAGTATKNTLQKILGTDIMVEINKAGMTDLAETYSKNILPK